MKNRLLDQSLDARLAGNISLGKQLLEDCLREDPNNAEAYRELALVEYRMKNSWKAKELIECSLEINPDSAQAHLYRAFILNNLDVYPEATEEFELALVLSKDDNLINVLVHSMYGDVLIARGCLQEAKTHFEEALRKDKNYMPAQESYRKLLRILVPNSGAQ